MANLRVTTYNSTGLAHDKRKYIEEIAENSDVLFLQEHWQHKRCMGVLNDLHKDFCGTGVSGMPEEKLHKVGRPYGGSGILYRNSISHQVEHITTNIKNVSAIFLNDLLLINVYLPGDNYRATEVSAEFRDTVDKLDNFIATQKYQMLLMGGDFNTSLGRDNAHTKYIKDFATRSHLHFIQVHPLAVHKITYQQLLKNGCVRQSDVDHFLVSEDIYNAIVRIECKPSIDNPSYHLPLSFEFVYDFATIETSNVQQQVRQSIAWHKVNDRNVNVYRQILKNKLGQRKLPDSLFCKNVFCECPIHRQEIDEYCKFIVDACLNAANDCLPKNVKKSGEPKSTPYWNDEVRSKREDSLEAKWVWESIGRPNSGPIFDEMRGTKRRYHYAVRRIKRKESCLRNKRMAEALSSGRNSDMWSETRKAQGGSKKPSNIDGIFNDCDISSLFARNNRDVYNSVPSNAQEISNLCSLINSRLKSEDICMHKCTVANVLKCINRCKHGKSDGDVGLMSDHVKHAADILSIHLGLLYNAIICHGYVPIIMLRGSITHIPKDPSGMLCKSCNYRGICLCIVFTKIFEDLFMLLYADLFDTSGLQFAYKKKLSTNVATLTLKELLRYYRLRSTRVFGCALDASKAFDRVRHDKLFDILLHRGLPPIMLRVLIDMYTRQVSRCVYFTSQSEYYSIANGVRQGGVASPILFIVYMDVLYCRLKDAGIGLHVGLMYYGLIGYADDLMLLASSMRALQCMLKTCEEFGIEYDVTYNPGKSKVIVFNTKERYEGKLAVLNGCEIKIFNELDYLGNRIRNDLSDASDIKEKVSGLNSSTNSLCQRFGSASYAVKCKLFVSQCVHAYGAETWDLSANECQAYYGACRQAVRRVMGLPPSCPSSIVDSLSGIPNGETVVMKKARSIIKCFEMSDNVHVAAMYQQAMSDCRSIIRKNLNVIDKHVFVPVNDVSPECYAIKELLDVRDGSMFLDVSPDDIDAFVMMFCMR